MDAGFALGLLLSNAYVGNLSNDKKEQISSQIRDLIGRGFDERDLVRFANNCRSIAMAILPSHILECYILHTNFGFTFGQLAHGLRLNISEIKSQLPHVKGRISEFESIVNKNPEIINPFIFAADHHDGVGFDFTVFLNPVLFDVVIFINNFTSWIEDKLQTPTPDSHEISPVLGSIRRAEHLDALLATVPKDASYERQSEAWAAVRQDFNRRLASGFVDTLKAGIAGKDYVSYNDKKTLVSWINGELRRFDLAIKSPKTGRVAILSADTAGRPGEGRFKIKGEDEHGKPVTWNTPDLAELLKNLDLMEAPPRREALREWRGKISRDDNPSSRS